MLVHHRRALRSSCRVMLFALVASCADSALAPKSPAGRATRDEIATEPARYNLLERTTPLDRVYWSSEWVRPVPKEQSVKIRQAGITVSFPAGSVTEPIYVTIVAHPGKLVSYEFFPHGVTFAKPVKIQQDLHETAAWKNGAVMGNLVGGYLARGWYDIDFATGTAPLAELFPVEYYDDSGVFTKTTPALVKFYTTHFSGYVLASGYRPLSVFGQ